MGDWCTGKIFAATLDCSGTWTRELVLDTDFNISVMAAGEDGELYVVEWALDAARVFAVTSTPLATLFRSDFEGGHLLAWSCTSEAERAPGGQP
ncbi:MAG: hypothetical protein R2991_09450 [Thermoanaerobaculia bacterium]